MKILVFSDSHGTPAYMQKAVDMHPDANMIIHTGDGLKDLELLKNTPKNVFSINGNFEDTFFFGQKDTDRKVIEVCGKRILICHGHRQNVSHSFQKLIYSALEDNADVAVFGHTHVKFNSYIPKEQFAFPSDKDGIYLFNPGSISRPRDCTTPSFGLIEIENNGILLSHGIINKC